MLAEKSRLQSCRTLAINRRDTAEVQLLDKQIALLQANSASQLGEKRPREEDLGDLMAKVNERNRRANEEAVRAAEAAEQERRRRERKLGITNTNNASDPSARLKIIPKLSYDSRYGRFYRF